MQIQILREPSVNGCTFGQLSIDGVPVCLTLEDEIREVEGEPVDLWKVKGETAIPSGLYRVTMEYSPKFGMDTITINDVPGFSDIRIHGGTTAEDTKGCPLVGDRIDREHGTISGAKWRAVLVDLKARVRQGLAAGPVWISIVNPPA